MSFIHLECWPEHQSVMLAVFKHVNNFFSLISKCMYHKQIWNTSLKQAGRDFVGGPALKTACFYRRAGRGWWWWGAYSIPGQRPKILHAEQFSQKKKDDCLKLVGKFSE